MDQFQIPAITKANLHGNFEDVFVAEGARLMGNLTIGRLSSVWYNAVIRADINKISIGEKTNVQDNTVIHIANHDPVVIGNNVTIGHGAIIHGCTIADAVLIGMGATILNGATIGKGAVIGAGTLIKENQTVEPYSLYVGVPGRKIRSLTEESYEKNLAWAEKYYQLSLIHQKTSSKNLL